MENAVFLTRNMKKIKNPTVNHIISILEENQSLTYQDFEQIEEWLHEISYRRFGW